MHARKRTQETAFAFMRVNACKLTRIQVHVRAHAGTSACVRTHARTLDRIRAHNERFKLIADECHSVCDNYIPRVTRTKLIKLRDRWPCTCNFISCALNGVHIHLIARTYTHALVLDREQYLQTHANANKRTQTHHCDWLVGDVCVHVR